MTHSTEQSPSLHDDEARRTALDRSMKEASETHPENYKDEENDDKVVDISHDATIQDIDPEPHPVERK